MECSWLWFHLHNIYWWKVAVVPTIYYPAPWLLNLRESIFIYLSVLFQGKVKTGEFSRAQISALEIVKLSFQWWKERNRRAVADLHNRSSCFQCLWVDYILLLVFYKTCWNDHSPSRGFWIVSQINCVQVCSERGSSRCGVCVCSIRKGIESSVFTYSLWC